MLELMSILIDCSFIPIIFRNKPLQPKDGETPVITYHNILKSIFFPAALSTGITLFALPVHAQASLQVGVVRDVSMSYCNESEDGDATSFWPTTGHESVSASASVATYSKFTFEWIGGGTPSSSFSTTGNGSLSGWVEGVPTFGPSVSGSASANSSISNLTSATTGGVNEYRSAPLWTGSEYDLESDVPVSTTNWTFAVAGGASTKDVFIKIEANVTASQTMSLTNPLRAHAQANYFLQ